MTHSSFRTTVHLSFLFFKEAARLLPFRPAGTLFPNSILLCPDILISANPSSPIGPVPQPLS